MEDLIGLFFIFCLLWLYMMFAVAVAGLGAVLGAIDSVATFVARLGEMVLLGIKTRGGDQRVSSPPEPAYEIYVGPPLMRDFRGAFGVAVKDVQVAAKNRRQQATTRFKGAMRPLAIGVTIGAYVGAVIGVIVGSVVAVVLGVVVVVVAGFVGVGSRLLQALEKTRRRVRGAHFDCPSCHERAPLPVYVCPGCGAKHKQLLPGRWGIRRRRCECDVISLPVLESGGRHSLTAECPSCGHVMPGAGGIVPEIPVPIIGGPKAGKTAMLASVLVELDNRTQAGSSRLAVVDDSRSSFDQLVGDLRAGRVPAKTLDRDVTPALVAEVRSGSSRSALLYAHDVAGERYQQADVVRDMSPLFRSRGAVLLIDPFSLNAINASLDGRDSDRALIDPSAEDPQSVVERFVQALRESGRKDAKKLPVAIVLSKTDALGAGDGIRPGDEGESVSRWLEDHGGGNIVRLLQDEFDTLRFFAASALGRIPDPSNTAAFVPVGTISPFFWLLSENKISMTAAAAETEATVTEKLGEKQGAKVVEPWPRTPLFAPRPRSGGSYAFGLIVALVVLGGIVGLVAAASHSSNSLNASYAVANSNDNSGSSYSDNSGTNNSGSGNTASDSAGSDSSGSSSADSGSPALPQMSPRVAAEYAERRGTSNVVGVGPQTCSAGLTVSGHHTDCAFAANVRRAYEQAGIQDGVISATSPSAPSLGGLRMLCKVYSGNVVGCIGGIKNTAIVFFGNG